MAKQLTPVPIDMAFKIKTEIENASESDERTAMFHFQIFMNANKLQDVSARDFCKAIGMHETFKVEYKKMLNLRQMLAKQGYAIKTAA